MRLARDLAMAVEGIPDGGSVTLPVAWLRERLKGAEGNVAVDLTVKQAVPVQELQLSANPTEAPDIPKSTRSVVWRCRLQTFGTFGHVLGRPQNSDEANQ